VTGLITVLTTQMNLRVVSITFVILVNSAEHVVWI